MSSFSDSRFLYPRLVALFGLKCVQRAAYLSLNKVKFLESILAILEDKITADFHTLQSPGLFE